MGGPRSCAIFGQNPMRFAWGFDEEADECRAMKLELAQRAAAAGTPLISSMGAGNKLDPTAFEVADISKTSVCPLAKVMRKELKKRGIAHLKVVYSKEPPLTPVGDAGDDQNGSVRTGQRRQTPGSTAFVPSVVGLIIAGEVIKDLTHTHTPA